MQLSQLAFLLTLLVTGISAVDQFNNCEDHQDGQFPMMGDCSKYISCTGGFATFQKCPEAWSSDDTPVLIDLQYSYEDQECQHPDNYTCTENSARHDTCKNKIHWDSSTKYAMKSGGHYFTCDGSGILSSTPCTAGEEFDVWSRSCGAAGSSTTMGEIHASADDKSVWDVIEAQFPDTYGAALAVASTTKTPITTGGALDYFFDIQLGYNGQTNANNYFTVYDDDGESITGRKGRCIKDYNGGFEILHAKHKDGLLSTTEISEITFKITSNPPSSGTHRQMSLGVVIENGDGQPAIRIDSKGYVHASSSSKEWFEMSEYVYSYTAFSWIVDDEWKLTFDPVPNPKTLAFSNNGQLVYSTSVYKQPGYFFFGAGKSGSMVEILNCIEC